MTPTADTAVDAELPSAEKNERAVKRIWFWGGCVVAIIAGTFAVFNYFGGFAKGATVEEHERSIGDLRKAAAVHDTAILNLNQKFVYEHEDIQWLMRQAAANSHAAHVPVEPMPEHEKQK